MDPTVALKTLNAIADDPPTDAKTRKQLYHAARRLMFATEGHHELTHRVTFSVGGLVD
jgi:hypothetical protein